MSVQKLDKELRQWGYVALVSLALAFTTVQVATARAAQRDPYMGSYSGGACTLPVVAKKENASPLCAEKTRIEEFQAALHAAFDAPLNYLWESHKSKSDAKKYVD